MNITLSIDEHVAEQARKAASAMGKSLDPTPMPSSMPTPLIRERLAFYRRSDVGSIRVGCTPH